MILFEAYKDSFLDSNFFIFVGIWLGIFWRGGVDLDLDSSIIWDLVWDDVIGEDEVFLSSV